jgi:hypothetical protein
MDEKLRSKAVVMILQKSHPSMILFPNDEKIVINYSGRRFWAINMKEGEESVSFGKTKTGIFNLWFTYNWLRHFR